MTTRSARSEKLDLRLSPAAKQALRAAATAAHRSISTDEQSLATPPT
jgi:uncharacterized protein (DUF1778 family)